MIHTTTTLSIREYGIIDQTDNISLLKRWWNVFPVGWFDTDSVIQDITHIVNNNIDSEVVSELGKIIRYNKILLLEALHIGIYNLIVLKPDNDQWNITKKKRTNLIEYIKKVELLTTIKIKDLKGLTSLKKEIERLADKYQEMYNVVDEPKKEAIPFLRLAYSIFGIMEMDYNPDLKMNEFGELMKSASKKIDYLKSLKRKNGK